MYPELFTIPFLNFSIKSYGAMMVLGFLLALWLARWRAKKLNEDPDQISNFALWALLLGVIGARTMHVIHNWSDVYRDRPAEIFAVWSGGLEFLGGFILAVFTLIIWCKIKKRPLFKFLDILAPSLMLGLGLGRLGCLLNGCCYGAVCTLPWALQFPALNSLTQFHIGSERQVTWRYCPPYEYQLTPDLDRAGDAQPLIQLPDDFYDGYTDGTKWAPSPALLPPDNKFYPYPKHPDLLTDRQRQILLDGHHPMRAVHPTQIYSALNALLICIILNALFTRRKFTGQIAAFCLILYGPARFLLESLRTDNPIEFTGLTISQNLALIALITGIILYATLSKTLGPNQHPSPDREGGDG